jgi:hypothetical protein
MTHNNGWLGRHHTEESKSKNRLTHLGKQLSVSTRAKISKAHIGLVHTEETRAKMRQSKLGHKRSEETKAKLRYANLGKQLSAEHKAKLLQANLGRRFTEEHKAKLRVKKSIETRIKMSKAQMGNHKHLGIPCSDETKMKMSQAKRKQWQNLEYKTRVLKASMLGRFIHPNKPERLLNDLLESVYPKEWKFVGDGQLIIAGRNPDFVNINGQKKLIELFGNYWHKGQNAQDRIDIFAQYGFSTLVIWESELCDMGRLTENVKTFCTSAPQLKTTLRLPEKGIS